MARCWSFVMLLTSRKAMISAERMSPVESGVLKSGTSSSIRVPLEILEVATKPRPLPGMGLIVHSLSRLTGSDCWRAVTRCWRSLYTATLRNTSRNPVGRCQYLESSSWHWQPAQTSSSQCPLYPSGLLKRFQQLWGSHYFWAIFYYRR